MIRSYIGQQAIPAGVIMPAGVQLALTAGLALVVAGALVFGVRRLQAQRDPDLLILLGAGFAAVSLEALAVHLIKGMHAPNGAYVLYQAFGKVVPVHMGLAYAAFFGISSHIFIRQFQARPKAATFWLTFAIVFVLATCVEFFGINAGLWLYYDNQPFVVWNFPLHYALVNTTLDMIFALSALFWFSTFDGPMRFAFVLAAPVVALGGYTPLAAPVAMALHADAGTSTVAIAAALGAVICLLIASLCLRAMSSLARA